MLAPKRQKYRKHFRGKNRGNASRGFKLDFGEYGLKAMQRGHILANQIEAARKAIAHYTQREGKVWIRIFPDKPITAKASGTRMGGGKGDIQSYAAVVAPGKILFELAGVNMEIASQALSRAADKLPIKTKFLRKGIM